MNTNRKLALLSLAWPIFLETFLIMLMGNVNILMLGRYADNAVGAVGVANQINNMLLMLYNIVALGISVIITQYLGAGDRKTAAKAGNLAMMINLVFGLTISITIAVFAKGILQLMNIPEELMIYAHPYLVIVASASFMQALIATMSVIARSYGQTKIPMVIAVGMNIINITLNYLVVFRPFGFPDFGVVGVAMSVVISTLVGVIVMFRLVFKGMTDELYFFIPRPFPKELFKKIVIIGLPSAGNGLSYNMSQIASTYVITMLGANALITRTYMGNIIQFILVLAIAIGRANQIILGHMVGAGECEKAYRVCLKNIKLACACNFTMALIFYIFRGPLIGIYTDNAEIVSMLSMLLVISLILEPGRAFNIVLNNGLNSTGDVKFPVIVSVVFTWCISVLFSYVLGIYFKLGILGVFIAFTADEWIRGLILLQRWRSRKWESKRVVCSVETTEIA